MRFELKKYREMAGMSQLDLVVILRKYDKRIDVPMLSKFESGVCLPTIDMAQIIAGTLDASVNEIWVNESDEAPVNMKKLESNPVLALIPHGSQNGIRSDAIARIAGCSERRARKMIEEAIVNGALIGNLQNGKGYFIPDNELEIIQVRNQERRRAMTIMKKVRTYNNVLRERGYWI